MRRINLAVNQYKCGFALDSHSCAIYIVQLACDNRAKVLVLSIGLAHRECIPLAEFTLRRVVASKVNLIRKEFPVLINVKQSFEC